MISGRVPPAPLTPVEIEPRKPLTLSREVEILRRFVFCAGCRRLMSSRAEYQYDHEIALALGGKDRTDNMRPYCVAECHPTKTKRDQSIIAKVKRLAGETCAGPTRHPIRSPGFDQTRTRHVNGTVTQRPQR